MFVCETQNNFRLVFFFVAVVEIAAQIKLVSSLEAITELRVHRSSTVAFSFDFLLFLFCWDIYYYIICTKTRMTARAFRDIWSLVMFFKFSNCTRLRFVQFVTWFVTKSNEPRSHAYKCYLHYSINPWQLLYRLQHTANQQSFPCCWSGQHLISYVLSTWTWFWEKKKKKKRKNLNNFAYAFNLKKFQMQCLFASD